MGLTMCGEQVDFLDRYRGHIAINVKVRSDPKLSQETLTKLARLDGAVRDQVIRFAEEAVRDSWWASMRERSVELGTGNLWSEGRSGGWLVFDMTLSQWDEFVEAVESQCKHCGRHFDHHIEGKCPFEASVFDPEDEVKLKKWNAFKQFNAEVKESLRTIGDALEHEVLFQLENLDDDGAAGHAAAGGFEANPQAFDESHEDDGV